MKIDKKAFSEEYQRTKERMRDIETMLGNNYTRDPDWLWLDGRKTAFEWIMRMAE